MSLLVLDPGIESRIVDMGRPRTRSLGVPVGGAADRRFLVLGNALLGNPAEAAALEVTLKGPRLRAQLDLGCSICGAPFEVWHGDIPIAINHTFTLRAGDQLQIGSTRRGVRAYLCVRGGFQTTTILDSRSALEPIRKGDLLPCDSSVIRSRFGPCPASFDVTKDYLSDVLDPFTVLPGLQASWFNEAEFHDQTFTVTPASNRMGLRLKGKPLTMPRREMVSEPVCPGAIQVTPDGQCIVLGVDGQTIGGYPKIAQVVQADLDLLAQQRPNQPIRFLKVSNDHAAHLDRQARARLCDWALRLRVSLDAFPAERTL